MRGKDFRQIPKNPHQVSAGAILLPTTSTLTLVGSSSLDFVVSQGGDAETFIFLFGIALHLKPFEIIEGIFLNSKGPGFHPTWGVEQLFNEIQRGGWTVIPVEQVLEKWTKRVEERMRQK